mgnify:FL=1|tara:strand:+ start:6431 stop:7099 length:669 start_codon:yes stop_codon:yes gene_type:complete
MTHEYFKAANDWQYNVHEHLKRSNKIAWSIALGATLLATLSIFALVLVMPLKEFAPYVVTVEKATGYVEVSKGLNVGTLREDESITIANLAQYVLARETFDAADFKHKYKFVELHSAPMAQEQYKNLFKDSNPDNPVKKYGHEAVRSVEIKNVTFLNESKDTAAVRFSTKSEYQKTGRISDHHYMSIIKFRYVQTPEQLKNRFINPLGFQVTSYRRDTEISN